MLSTIDEGQSIPSPPPTEKVFRWSPTEHVFDADEINSAYLLPDSSAINASAACLWLCKSGRKVKQTCRVAQEGRLPPQCGGGDISDFHNHTWRFGHSFPIAYYFHEFRGHFTFFSLLLAKERA